MNNKMFSEEVIEIGGKEYTLWINRIGISNWEKATKLKSIAEDMKDKYANFTEGEIELNEDSDPFAGDYDIDEDEKKLYDVYSKFYWMALYKNHKFTITEADEIFKVAVEEYGIEQLAELAQQMLTNANTDNSNLKNLKALKSTK